MPTKKAFSWNAIQEEGLYYKNSLYKVLVPMLPSSIKEFIKSNVRNLSADRGTVKNKIEKLDFCEIEWYRLLRQTLEYASQEKSASIDPLGEIYEYFLSNELVQNNKTLQIHQKDKKQKIQGTVYTPFKIVQLISELIWARFETKTQIKFKQNKEIRVGDLASGTGRFLLGWHLQQEAKNNPTSFSQTKMFGFDIDPTALKIATAQAIPNTFLIQKDPLLEFDIELSKGFDIILGNPPYIESRGIPDAYWNLLRDKYKAAHKKFDISVVFLERIIQLLQPNGWAGLIISNKWLVSDYGAKVREQILSQTQIDLIIDISQLDVFHGTSIYPIIILFQKITAESPGDHIIRVIQPQSLNELFLHSHKLSHIPIVPNDYPFIFYEISQKNLMKTPDYRIAWAQTTPTNKNLNIFQNLSPSSIFYLNSDESPYELRKGIHTGNVKQKLITLQFPSKKIAFKKLLTSREKVGRYFIQWEGKWIHYNPDLIDRNKGDYASLREPWIFESSPKILIKLFGKRVNAAIDLNRYYANNSLILLVKRQNFTNKFLETEKIFDSIEQEFYFLLGILNSNAISEFYHANFSATQVRGGFLQYYIRNLAQIPIPIPSRRIKTECLQIAAYAKQLSDLFTQDHKKGTLKMEDPTPIIAQIEAALNQMVIELYISQ